VNGAYVIRMSIGQTYTQQRHVEEGWAVIRELAAAI
jgi:aromatic-L-amino-acid decarboxylase